MQSRQLLPGITAGLIAGVVTVVIEISFAALIFDGNLSMFIASGIGFTLFGAFILIIITTLTSSFPSIISFPQDSPVVILSIIAAGISSSMPVTATAEETYSTVVISIVLTSLLSSGFFLALGTCKLGRFIRFIPYPVIGGFLAGTGWLLAKGGLEVMTGLSLSWSLLPGFFQTEMLLKWISGSVFAFLLIWALRRYNHFLIMPAMICTVIGIFYLLTWLTKTSIAEAGTRGWFLGPFPENRLWQPIRISTLALVHWKSIWSQTGNIIIILVVSTISLLLNTSGLELISQRDMDLNRELKVAGWANLAAGFVGSPTGYHTLSLSALGFKIGSNSRLVGIFAALLCGTVLWFGASIVSFFPRFILGGLLFFIGLSFLAEWVFDAWFKLTKVDYFLVLFILFVIGTFGFLEGVGVGVLVSVMIFIVNYSRVEVINRTFSGDSMQSNADRSPLQRRLLRQKGDQSYILKLQGFIFFGTAHTLYQHVHKRLGNSNFPVLRYIVFDFRRVRGLDGSAEIAFIKILRLAKSCSVRLVFTSLSPQFQNRLKRAFTGETVTEDVHFFLDLDHGLEWCENQILITDHVQLTEAPQNLNDQLKSIFSRHDHVRILMTYLEKRHVEREHYLIRQGERSEYLYFIESGEFSAQLELEGEEPIRLRTMRAGAIFGEIALYLKIPRSLSIIATQPGNVYQLSAKALKEMETAAPDLAMAFQNYVIRLLAERLVDLNRTLEALSD